MKIRKCFVSNSSSSSFLIDNLSNETKTIVDFALENYNIFEQYCEDYGEDEAAKYLEDAESLLRQLPGEYTWGPGESLSLTFGDEQYTLIGSVYYYNLRYGGSSKNFNWNVDVDYN